MKSAFIWSIVFDVLASVIFTLGFGLNNLPLIVVAILPATCAVFCFIYCVIAFLDSIDKLNRLEKTVSSSYMSLMSIQRNLKETVDLLRSIDRHICEGFNGVLDGGDD